LRAPRLSKNLSSKFSERGKAFALSEGGELKGTPDANQRTAKQALRLATRNSPL